ncbi:MAG: ABC transporter ATP-binding protein [Clostridiales bacterium]|nr:ABC transporter ATP-binding protein [Candidatus Apopatousia equi]
MKRILKTLNKLDYLIVLLCIMFIVGQVWLDLTMPDYMNKITTLLQTEGQIGDILKNGGMMVLCALGSLALSFLVGYFVSKLAAKIGMNFREQIYDKVGSFSKYEISKFSTSSLITRCTNDTTQVQNLVAMGLQIIVKSPILAIWAICKILGKSWQWSVVTLIAVVFMLIAITVVIILCLPRFKIIQKQTDDLNRVTRENLTGIRIVHAFNAESFQEEKFDEVNTNLTKTHTYTSKALSFLSPILQFVIGGLSLAIYWVGAYIINGASMMDKIGLFSDMVVFLSYAMQVVSAFIMLVIVFMLLPRTIVSIKRIEEVLTCSPSINDGSGATTKQVGTIEFKDVNFRYPDGQDYVLSNINLKIEKGETVAFIGATGSGKTTLVDLVPRFYDATSGEVLIDGQNVKNFTLEDLRNRIGYVSQKAIILSGTVFDNISMGHDIETKDVINAIDYAEAKEFVDKMEKKENAVIYQSGKNISGGQKQRLSIARAIAKKPEFIIFDDSFSALDYKTDKKLRTTLDKKFKGITRLIVAQRIGTIKNADKIVVVDNGKIVGVGTHEELLDTNKVYKEIALSQLSEEELKNGSK